ncbi:MAG: PKD domain-containing protein [bacterium]
MRIAVPQVIVACLVALMFLLAGCQSDSRIESVPAGNASLAAGPDGSRQLPFPPGFDSAERQSSLTLTDFRFGDQALERNANTSVFGTDLMFSPLPGELSWAIFQFSDLRDWYSITDFELKFASLPDSYYAGVADFESGRWIWRKLGLSAGGSGNVDTLPWPAAAKGITTQGYAYLVIVFDDPAGGTLNQITINFDNPETGPDLVLLSTPRGGNAPLDISLTANATDTNGGGIALYEWDWDGDGVYDQSGTLDTELHTYPAMGDYYPVVRVTDDNDGLSETEQIRISVRGWSHTLGGNANDVIYGTAANEDGVVMVGSTYDAVNLVEGVIARYDTLGNLLWQKIWSGADSQTFDDVAITAEGEIIVAGETEDAAVSSAAVVMKLSADGNLVWAYSWDTSGADFVGALDIDPSGNIWITGQSFFADFGVDIGSFVIQFNSEGALGTAKGIVNTDRLRLRSIDAASDSAIYVVGDCSAYVSGQSRFTLFRLDGSGNIEQEHVLDLPNCQGHDVFYDEAMNRAIACGNSNNGVLDSGLFLSAATDGTLQWLTTTQALTDNYPRSVQVARDANGFKGIYGAGFLGGAASSCQLYHLDIVGMGVGGMMLSATDNLSVFDLISTDGGALLLSGSGPKAGYAPGGSAVGFTSEASIPTLTGTSSSVFIGSTTASYTPTMLDASLTEDSGAGSSDCWLLNYFPADM